jgi:hypothetical protein
MQAAIRKRNARTARRRRRGRAGGRSIVRRQRSRASSEHAAMLIMPFAASSRCRGYDSSTVASLILRGPRKACAPRGRDPHTISVRAGGTHVAMKRRWTSSQPITSTARRSRRCQSPSQAWLSGSKPRSRSIRVTREGGRREARDRIARASARVGRPGTTVGNTFPCRDR